MQISRNSFQGGTAEIRGTECGRAELAYIGLFLLKLTLAFYTDRRQLWY